MKTEPNVYHFRDLQLYAMAYVDDLVVVGPDGSVSKLHKNLEQHLLVKILGDLCVDGCSMNFLGRLVSRDDAGINLMLHPQSIT